MDIRPSDKLGFRSRDLQAMHVAGDLLLWLVMTAPRPVFPERFLFNTRRCTQREFLLRPDAATNNVFTYALAEAAQRHDITIILSRLRRYARAVVRPPSSVIN